MNAQKQLRRGGTFLSEREAEPPFPEGNKRERSSQCSPSTPMRFGARAFGTRDN